MVNRMILAMLLLGTATAHAQVGGAGGAPRTAATEAAPPPARVLLPERVDAAVRMKAKVKAPRWLTIPRSAPPSVRQPPARSGGQAARKER